MNILDEVRWGFIGCGEVTEKKSGPAFSMIEGSKVVAVMSRDKDKARSYAERNHIPKYYTDPQSLIADKNVNAVYIATPPSSHATFAIMAMKAGKPVYVEKPMAVSYEECLRINRVSAMEEVPCFVAYYRRYLPYFRKVADLLKSDAIGKILNVQLRFAVPPRELDYNSDNLPWRLQPDIAGAGYFYDLAPHQLDLLQLYFGAIIEAEGYCCNRANLYKVEDSISATAPIKGSAPPAWNAAVTSAYLLTKPARGGTPVRDRPARVKQAKVKGILRPRPCICRIWVRPVWVRTEPAQKNRMIFVMLWNTMCARPAVAPSRVKRHRPNSM